ncbi:MAG: hypothetical protein LBU79_06345 [Planctomycetota bacterium]|jgi:hypothetical protein|nr:hypothetical protein [Planctomycetota bacterium]
MESREPVYELAKKETAKSKYYKAVKDLIAEGGMDQDMAVKLMEEKAVAKMEKTHGA